MSHSWLQRKRKGDLLDLAQKARLSDADGLLKDDIVELLANHLNANETRYAKHPDFRDYYGRSGSPMKRERSSPSEALSAAKPRRRTLVKAPSEEPTPEKSELATRTPSSLVTRTASNLASRTSSNLESRTPRTVSKRVSEIMSEVDMPASPAQLAEVADQSFQVMKTKATELWDRTQVDEFKELIRENASSVATIQTLILLIEAVGLQWNTLDTTALFGMPTPLASWSNSQDVKGPNGWALLTAEWWAPATLWSLTSWVLPLVFSYFFNLTLRSNTSRKSSDRQYPADPLVFNITRAILAYSAYRGFQPTETAVIGELRLPIVQDNSNWGPFSAASVDVVRQNVPGGYYGLQIGTAVGILVSLYDAALKK